MCPQPPAISNDATHFQLPVPGNLYALDACLAGWGPKSRYYNPPVVLVLSLPDAQSVFVCQTYCDKKLAGPDDVPLESGLAGFAQPWNCYTLRREDLGLYLGTVSAQVVERVWQQSEQEQCAPQPGSLLWFFRQMEVETGFFFSQRAVTMLLEQHDRALSLVDIDKNSALQDLRKLPLQFTNPDLTIATPIELLCWAEADPGQLPLAAADAKTTSHSLVFTMNYGTIIAAEQVPISISFHEYADGRLTVNGSVDSLPSGALTWFFRWQSGEQLIEPLPDHFGHDDKFFWVTFSLRPEQTIPPAHLVVRIVHETR